MASFDFIVHLLSPSSLAATTARDFAAHNRKEGKGRGETTASLPPSSDQARKCQARHADLLFRTNSSLLSLLVCFCHPEHLLMYEQVTQSLSSWFGLYKSAIEDQLFMRVRRPTKSAALLVGSMHACLFACRTSQHVVAARGFDLQMRFGIGGGRGGTRKRKSSLFTP